MKLNKNERARLEQVRQWARQQLRADLDAQQVMGPLYQKLVDLVKERGLDPTLAPNNCLWLIKLIDRELGTAPSTRKFLAAIERHEDTGD